MAIPLWKIIPALVCGNTVAQDINRAFVAMREINGHREAGIAALDVFYSAPESTTIPLTSIP